MRLGLAVTAHVKGLPAALLAATYRRSEGRVLLAFCMLVLLSWNDLRRDPRVARPLLWPARGVPAREPIVRGPGANRTAAPQCLF